ncbi:hypothetical protein KPL70_001133 [Citrus sinensis]|nr:hypothetical protein KPL70_001133 [Citrus sinensis]
MAIEFGRIDGISIYFKGRNGNILLICGNSSNHQGVGKRKSWGLFCRRLKGHTSNIQTQISFGLKTRFTAPHPAVLDNEIQSTLHNYLCQLNHQTPPHKDIFHTSLGPQHDLIMIPTPSTISKPKSTGIIIKEERPDYTDFLYQNSQDPWEEFLPLSQHLQQLTRPPRCQAPSPGHHPPNQDTDEITLIHLAVVPTVNIQSSPKSFSQQPLVTLTPMKLTAPLKMTTLISTLHKVNLRATGPKDRLCSVVDLVEQRHVQRFYCTFLWSIEIFLFMASTSSSTSSNPVTLSSTLSLPKSCTSHTTNKIKNLVEYSYIPESAQISESSYPLISPYQLYKRPSSFTRSIRTLISTKWPHPKEYIQSSRLDQCALQATSAEQYVTLEIPSELLSNWKREGYTHLRLGGIQLILTLHGRKELPVTARIVMLDTRFKQYQDVVIGTVLTTLHAGSVLLTFYPNFNLSLQNPNLPTTLKVQVQIQGAEQISSAKIATLHHQLVYRLQNHALDLPTPKHHSDTLMVLAESDQIPTIIQIPRQIPRHELIKLMPLEWISNYEQFHNNTAPIQTSETKQNGHFLWDAPGSGMCDPNCPCWNDWDKDDDYATTRKRKPKKKKPPASCQPNEPKSPKDPPPPPAPLPIYKKELTWIAKHCRYEVPSPNSNSPPIVQPLACMMFSSTSSSYSSSFPPLETHTDSQRNVVSKPFIPSAITSTGHFEPPKPFESVLNWQTQNARAQNDTLLNINSKVEKINLQTEQLETKVDSITAQMQQIHQNLLSRITQLDFELRTMPAQHDSGPKFDQKEKEIRRLKAELAQIESDKQRPTLFTTSPPIPTLFGMTHTLFRDNPLPPPPKPKPKPKPQPRPVTIHHSSISIPGQQSPGYTPASPPAPPSPSLSQPPLQSKDKEPMHQFSAQVDHSSSLDDQTSYSNLAISDSHTETDTESSASTSDSEKSYANITRILMAQPDHPAQGQTSHPEPYVDIPSEVEEEMPESSATNQPPPAQAQPNPPSQKSSNGPWFTFDDLLSHKWRDRLNEMSA